MKSVSGTRILQLGAALTLLTSGMAIGDERLERSRAIADEFQRALGGELSAAMRAAGPPGAIDVCREVAPALAERASRAWDADVGRTALRLRNPGNAPDPDATAVLGSFQERLRGGDRLPLEHFDARPDGSARYMRAIVLEPQCVTCHGSGLAPEVAAAVADRYPDDQAIGFEVGDLRGAFIIDWQDSREEPLP